VVADRTNLVTALRYLEERSALSPLEAARDFLDAGGRFTRTHYQAVVAARDLRHGLSLLASGPFRWLSAAATEGKPVSIPAIERRLDGALIRKAVALSRHDPVGIGVMLAYLERKINEVRNLRMIVRGRSLSMGPEQIDEWLIFT
jgi:vacuolar-type H+-ATPase subunit C/Vma6